MNRRVVVTGVSSGLGLSLVKKFLAAGDEVDAVSRDPRRWKQALQSIGPSGRLVWHRADVSSEPQVKRLVKTLMRRRITIDVLVNNAGYSNKPVALERESLVELRKNMRFNLESVFLMCRDLIPYFQKQNSGWILNVSSMAGTRAVPRLAGYSASKFGVLALTQAMAKENGDKKFRAITVCPGGMNTPLRAKLFGPDDAGRQQSPDFVAGVILDVVDGKIEVESAGDIVIRHGKITAIHPAPAA